MNQGRREGSENHNGRPEVCYHVCTKNLALSFLEAKREKKIKILWTINFSDKGKHFKCVRRNNSS